VQGLCEKNPIINANVNDVRRPDNFRYFILLLEAALQPREPMVKSSNKTSFFPEARLAVVSPKTPTTTAPQDWGNIPGGNASPF
jgi:hypothetical protein